MIFNNRHVLRPIAHLAYVCKEPGKWDRFMALARWLVHSTGLRNMNGAPKVGYS